jgi:hypothetical protein
MYRIFVVLSVLTLIFACKNADTTENQTANTSQSAWSGCTLKPEGLDSVKVGQPIPKGLRRSIVETEDGKTSTIYQIRRSDGQGVLAKVYPMKKEGEATEVVRMIEYIATDCRSDKGVGVGSTIADIRNAYPDVKIISSEGEGITTAYADKWAFLLHSYNLAGELPADSINQNIKVKAIVFQ